MKVGIGIRCITPQKPLILAGYAGDRTFHEVHDDLYVKCLSISGNEGRGLIITADLIGFGRGLVDEVKAELKAEHGLPVDCILVTASHTHSGPAVLEHMTANWPVDHEYMAWLKRQILAAAADALRESEPCRLILNRALCPVSVNRRWEVNDEWVMMPNEAGPRDDEVMVIRMLCENGSPKVLLFNYACHQTTVNLPAISGDFAGHAQRVLESELSGVTALYLQGCEGDVRPRTVEGDRFRPGTWADVERFGDELATAVLEACRNPTMPVEAERVSGGIAEARLPFSDLPTEEVLRRAATADESLKEHHTRAESTFTGRMERAWGRKLLAEGLPLRTYAPFRIQRLSVGDKVHLIGLEGEVCVEYGLKLKAMGRARSQVFIPVGIANGLLQYIPTAKIRRQGGYASSIPFKGWGLPGPFAPELEEEIWRAMGTVLA